MTTSSAADWCRAVLEEVSPSPLNNVPPLPAHVPVPPPPPPVYTGGSKQAATPSATWSTAAAAAVPQPSAQYQAYYDRYYQQATAAAQQTAISSSNYAQYQQQATAAYQLQQQQQQQQMAQYQQQLQQQQQEQILQHQQYQQPSYTSVVQHGTAAWQKAAAQHGVGVDKTNETTGSYQQQPYTKQQQYSQQQQQHIQQQQQQQQQQQAENSNQKPLGSMGTLLEMKKPVKSRFSSLPAAASTSNTTTQQKLVSSEVGGKGPAGDSMMPANWPTSLKMFVARSFSGCKTDEDRKNISQALEKLINKVAFENRITTHKWELEDISASLIPKAKVAVAVPYVEAQPKALPSAVSASRPTPTTNFEIRDSDLKPKAKVAQKASYRPTFDTLDNTYGPGAYGASSSAGNGTQISYGGYGNGYGNGNGNGKVKHPYSPSFSPSSASASASSSAAAAAVENDKKRKSRWDLDSNSSNGDSMATVFPKSMKQFKNETKHKSQKMLPSDHPASNSKKKESGSRIIEKPPTNAEQAMREKRASRFKESDVEVEVEVMRMPSLQSQSQILLGSKNKAKKRGSINNNYHNNEDKHNKNFSSSASDFDFESLIVIGTCQKLEKDYFRLTSAPIPNTVRPEDVLKRSLQLLKEKWNNASVEYVYMCSQFKSMRQDLTVQHIQNGFTVEVYECHARVALECRDLNEYNQCQTQLKQLYSAMHIQKIKCPSEMEFTAYRILYYVYLQLNKKYQNGSSDLSDIMSSLSPEAFKDPAVSHALLVRQSVQLDNYYKFFQLCRTTPNLGSHILDLMLENKRLMALQKIVRSYKPSVPVELVISILNFNNQEEGKDFVVKAGCVLVETTDVNSLGISMLQLGINTKDSVVNTSLILQQDKLLL